MVKSYVDPELETVELRIGASGETVLRNWNEYSFNSDFTTPTDGWSFNLGQSFLRPSDLPTVIPGARVQLYLGGLIQATGYIDKIRRKASKNGGVEWSIEGRDIMAPACDSHVDPRVQFKPTMTLAQIIGKAFIGSTKWTERTIREGNEDNIKQITGVQKKVSKKGKLLKKATAAQLKPTLNEGAFAFVARVLLRHGLFLWASADGSQLIVGEPDYSLPDPVTYRLTRRFDGSGINNVIDGEFDIDLMGQPTAIVAEGYAGGGDFGKSKTKCIMLNPFVKLLNKSAANLTAELKEKFRGAVVIAPDFPAPTEQYVTEMERIVYKHDQDAQTLEELAAYTRLQMSECTRKLVTAKYTVKGHYCRTPGGEYAPWAVDTVVMVDDEVAGVNGPMWVKGRTFTKSRSAGTRTTLDLIALHTIEFGS